MFGELYTIHMANNTKMGQNSTSQIPVKSEHGYSPKYPEHVFSVIGDFTKYGQPVSRPNLRGRNCPFSDMGVKVSLVRSNSTVFLRMDIFSQYGEVINSINPRDSYMHHWPGSPLIQIMDECLLCAKPLPEQILFIINCTVRNKLQWFFSRLKKYLEIICKLWSSCISLNMLKASFPQARYHHDYSNPLHIRKQHVFPIYLLTWLLEITLQHENMMSHEMITKCCNHLLRYCIA